MHGRLSGECRHGLRHHGISPGVGAAAEEYHFRPMEEDQGLLMGKVVGAESVGALAVHGHLFSPLFQAGVVWGRSQTPGWSSVGPVTKRSRSLAASSAGGTPR